MLSPILIGLLLTAATIAIHAVGTTWWLRCLARVTVDAGDGPASYWRQLKFLCLTSLVLLCLHITEVALWAFAYLIVDCPAVTTIEEAIYFSMVTFSSLGFGDIVIDSHWRIMSGIHAMTGLLVFGWSTALLFAVVQKVWATVVPNAIKKND